MGGSRPVENLDEIGRRKVETPITHQLLGVDNFDETWRWTKKNRRLFTHLNGYLARTPHRQPPANWFFFVSRVMRYPPDELK